MNGWLNTSSSTNVTVMLKKSPKLAQQVKPLTHFIASYSIQ